MVKREHLGIETSTSRGLSINLWANDTVHAHGRLSPRAWTHESVRMGLCVHAHGLYALPRGKHYNIKGKTTLCLGILCLCWQGVCADTQKVSA